MIRDRAYEYEWSQGFGKGRVNRSPEAHMGWMRDLIHAHLIAPECKCSIRRQRHVSDAQYEYS